YHLSNAVAAPTIQDDSPLATQLERDLSLSKGVTRWLYWMDALGKALPSDFPRLAKLTKGKRELERMVARRWAEKAPRHLFDTLVAAAKFSRGLPVGTLASALFEEWPKRDPEAA